MEPTPTPTQPKKYGKGCRKDPPHRRTQKSSREILGASPSSPPAASLEQHEAEIQNQGQSGSCGGHGSSQGITVACGAAGIDLGFVPSPDGIYKAIRCEERNASTPAGQDPAPLQDTGIMPSDIPAALANWGVRKMRAPTPDGRNSDVYGPDDVGAGQPTNLNTEPELADDEESRNDLVMGEYRIDETAPDFEDQVCAAIASGCPVGIGIFVDTGFERWGEGWAPGRAPIASVDVNDPNGGGHWLVITSYRTLADGTRVYRGPNSWDKTWGDNGHFEMTGAALRQCISDALVWKINVKAAA